MTFKNAGQVGGCPGLGVGADVGGAGKELGVALRVTWGPLGDRPCGPLIVVAHM